jgi:hypothetical protein
MNHPDRGFDSNYKLLFQVSGLLPDNVVVLPGVEVDILQIVLAATPDDWKPQSHGEAGLEVYSLSLHRNVGDDEPGAPDFGHDPVANLLVVMNPIHAKRLVASLADRRFDCFRESAV